jgi:catechol 2,3-dioxygenase-like lactoylglutathione lyase family enzyme
LSNPAPRTFFENSAPILRVDNMEASLRFYVDLLGFVNAPWGDDNFTCVTRDQASIYLCRQDQGRGGAWAWVGVEDVRALHAEYAARGAKFHLPPTNYPWALEMQLEDPDLNVLRFGSEPEQER